MKMMYKVTAILFCLAGSLCGAYDPNYRHSSRHRSTVEETAKKTSVLLTTILQSFGSNHAQSKADPDNHYSSIVESKVKNFFTGKLKPTRNNWFQILPTPVVTNDVSLNTVVGCVIASLGERLINHVEMEAIYHHGQEDVRLQWAEHRLSDFIRFLKRAICTFELVDMNKNIYAGYTEYKTFIAVIGDYLRVGKYLYKLAISAYRQVNDNSKLKTEFDITASCVLDTSTFDSGCSADVTGILKQLKCLSTCRQKNHCRNKITKLRKMLRRVRRMYINSIFRLKRK